MKYIIRGLLLGLVLSLPAVAQVQLLDKVAVIVDQGVVLESEVKAQQGGTIQSILVKEGDNVQTGDQLAIIG